jgi:hypothetical protein
VLSGTRVLDLEDLEEDEGRERFTIPFDILSGEPLPKVHVALLPTRTPWHVPLFLRFGNWNACPHPVVHARLIRAWNERYGAEPVGLSHDVLEMRVSKRPAGAQDASRLAVEQYAYCADLVDQGVGTVESLATLLIKTRSWYFWWD